MKSIKIRIPLVFAILVMPLAAIGVANTFKSETKTVKADELSELHTNFKLDWDNHTEISGDANGYKNFTNSGDDKALDQRVAGVPINLYDDTYSTYESPSPIYQVTPYSGYKSAQIRNYNNGNTTYYFYLNYGHKYDGSSERDYGNFVEFTPLGSLNTVIKSLTIKTRDGSSPQNLWYKTSDDGVSWTGDLSDTYKLTYTSSTKSFDLSLPIGVKYLRVHQCNNASQSLRTANTITQMSIGYEQSGSLKVTFDPQNGSATSSENVNSGDHLVEPPVPAKAPINGHRYEFVGWFDDPVSGNEWDFENDTVTEAGTLYAHYNDVEVSSYTVNYVSNGDTAVPSETVGLGEYFAKPSDPIKTSEDDRYAYTFDAWCLDEELTNVFDFEELPTEDVTLYGRYTKSIADVPAGSIQYNVKNYKSSEEPYASADPSYDNYQSRVMDSKQTFDYNSTSRPQIFLDVQGAGEGFGVKKGKAIGEATSDYDLVIKNSIVNITWADKTKVLSFVRIQFHRINYQTYVPNEATLSVIGSETVLSSCLLPGGTNHTDEDCLQASFTADQDVRGVSVSVLDSHVYVDLRYVILGFADEVVENVAVNYATAFNDAQVCGTNPGDGLNTSKWEAQATAFDDLSDNVKEYLSTYNGENAEIVEMLERYDRVIYLHGADYDFMGRIESMHIPYQTIDNTPLFEDSNTMVIVIAIAAVSALTLTTLLVLKKRKQR